LLCICCNACAQEDGRFGLSGKLIELLTAN
jgi:hypothetical protein